MSQKDERLIWAVYAKSDIELQINRLFAVATLSAISREQINQYPRYIPSFEIRLEKLPMQVSKDANVAR